MQFTTSEDNANRSRATTRGVVVLLLGLAVLLVISSMRSGNGVRPTGKNQIQTDLDACPSVPTNQFVRLKSQKPGAGYMFVCPEGSDYAFTQENPSGDKFEFKLVAALSGAACSFSLESKTKPGFYLGYHSAGSELKLEDPAVKNCPICMSFQAQAGKSGSGVSFFSGQGYVSVDVANFGAHCNPTFKVSNWKGANPTNVAASWTIEPLVQKLVASCPRPSKCTFPFTYNGQTYQQCTKANHNQPWCSYDAVYKGGWMNCNNIPANLCANKGVDCLHPKKCTFPFTYLGKAYHQCTKANHNQPWCSFDAAYKGGWMDCNGIPQDQCGSGSNVNPICSPAKLCKFPFTYAGKTFHGCTKENHHQLWCSIDSVYEGRWVNCEDKWCNQCKIPMLEIGEQVKAEDVPTVHVNQ